METLFGKSFLLNFCFHLFQRIRGKLQVADSAYVRKFNSCVCWLVGCFIGRDLLFLSILQDIVLNMHLLCFVVYKSNFLKFRESS